MKLDHYYAGMAIVKFTFTCESISGKPCQTCAHEASGCVCTVGVCCACVSGLGFSREGRTLVNVGAKGSISSITLNIYVYGQ